MSEKDDELKRLAEAIGEAAAVEKRVNRLALADLFLAIILVATARSLLHCEERVRAIEQRLKFYDSMLTTNVVEQFEAGQIAKSERRQHPKADRNGQGMALAHQAGPHQPGDHQHDN